MRGHRPGAQGKGAPGRPGRTPMHTSPNYPIGLHLDAAARRRDRRRREALAAFAWAACALALAAAACYLLTRYR